MSREKESDSFTFSAQFPLYFLPVDQRLQNVQSWNICVAVTVGAAKRVEKTKSDTTVGRERETLEEYSIFLHLSENDFMKL